MPAAAIAAVIARTGSVEKYAAGPSGRIGSPLNFCPALSAMDASRTLTATSSGVTALLPAASPTEKTASARHASAQKYLDEVLNNVYFYPFIANDFYASYSKETETIYLSGIPLKSLDSIERSITEYSFLIICLLHELFHFYFSTMRYISQNEKKFDSPTPKNGTNYAKKRGCESGEWLEEQLFGRLIKELHINESLLIFKMKEFSHMEDFRKEFLNVKTKTLNIGDFQNYFKNWIDISQFQSNIKNKEFDNNYVLRVWPTDIFDDCLRGDIFFFVPPKEQLEFIESTEKEVMKKEGDEFLKKIEQIIQNKLKKN